MKTILIMFFVFAAIITFTSVFFYLVIGLVTKEDDDEKYESCLYYNLERTKVDEENKY